MKAHGCNLSTQVSEAGESHVQSQPELYSEFQVMLGYLGVKIYQFFLFCFVLFF